jgi:hypothetical protein
MSAQYVDPNILDWTPAALRELRYMPIVAGDDYLIRYQFRDSSDAALDLTGAVVTMTVAGTTPFVRTSGVAIPGLSPAANGIDIDTDQTAENATLETGKGWVTIRFSRAAADRAALELRLADTGFDLVAVWAATTRVTQGRGKIAFLKAYTA